MKTIFSTLLPKLNHEGDWLLPKDMLFPGQTKPKLRSKEWWYLIFNNTEGLSTENRQKYIDTLGNKRTVKRLIKALKDKGFL